MQDFANVHDFDGADKDNVFPLNNNSNNTDVFGSVQHWAWKSMKKE